MKREHIGLLPTFVAVTVLALMAGSFPALSTARFFTLSAAILLFLAAIVFFNVRAGYIREMDRPRGGRATVISFLVYAAVVAAAVVLKRSLPDRFGASTFIGLIGFLTLCATIDQAGAVAAAGIRQVRNHKASGGG